MTDRSRRLDPPRPTPIGFQCAVLFSGGISQIGWSFVLIGTLAAWIFLSRADLGLTTYGAAARGVVEDVVVTKASENEQPILAFTYRFTAPDGREVTGVSYSVRREASVGQVVRVELDPDDPRSSRIEGMRNRPFGWPTIFVLGLPLFGLAAGAHGLRRGSRLLSLVRTGLVGTGRVVHVAQRGEDNDDPVFEVTVEHEVDGARHRFKTKRHRPDLHEGSERAILYRRAAPGRTALVDDMRGCRVDADGTLVIEALPAGVRYMLLPAAAAVAVLVAALAALS